MRALTSWKIQDPSGCSWSPRMFKYSWDFILLLHKVTEPNPDHVKLSQIITLPPEACTVGAMHEGFRASWASRLTLTLPSFCNKVYLDSSDPSLCDLLNGASRNFLKTFDEHASQLLNAFPPVCFYQSLQRTPVTSIQNFSSATITTEWLHFIIFFY